MLGRDACLRLREAFLDHDYSVDAVVDLIGERAHQALGRNSTVAAVRAIGGRTDPLAALTLLWPLQQEVDSAAVKRALPGLLDSLVGGGFLAVDGTVVRAQVDIRPYASDDGAQGWVVSDLSPGLDTHTAPIRPDFVLGVSPASTTLAQLTVRAPVRRALDLGSGCGVQSLHLARHADQVVAVDLNERANALAELTFAINDVDVDLRLGSLYEPVAGERFDLIVSNPPYVISPPRSDRERLTYREGDWPGDSLVQHVIERGVEHLEDGGTLQVLGNWAHVSGQDWAERLRGWIATTGCDALVVQRETLDPYEYIELWLSDAGLAGSADYRQRYQDWLDYFDRLGIEAVGMGWIVLHRTGRVAPQVEVEHWPYPVEQPIGPAIAAHQAAVGLEQDLSDADLLWRRWLLADDISQESLATPGAADPRYIVLRQQRGFRRAVDADTALAGILGACDGDLQLGQIVDTVAEILGADAAVLRTELVPRARRLIRDGFLVDCGH